MNTWQTYNLEKITTKIGSGATPRGGKNSYKSEGISLIRSMNVYDAKFEYKDLAFIDEKQATKLENVAVKKDDVLINITGASVCRCTLIPEKVLPARVNQHVSIIRADRKLLHPHYLRYYLIHPEIKKYLYAQASTGATRQALTKNDLETLEVKIPEYVYQEQIAETISLYDKLIENNQIRIKILEEMAQRLYTEWFVKFKFPGYKNIKMVDSGAEFGEIPEGREIKELYQLIDIKKGKNITRKTIKKGSTPVVAGGLEPAYFHNTANTIAPVITISASGANAGYVNIYYQNIWASDCSYIDSNATSFIYYYYLFFISKQQEINNLQRGSAQPHVYPKDLQRLKTVAASSEILEAFHKIVRNYYEEVRLLKERNEVCSTLRDLLIENLVTGKRLLKVKQ
ncbi:restriction endonuclease subunit S [Candidatus Woesebacteria bacterium]|nr:restriction endonuclease subunit S [Candidatus Woesebacteria bacterium]